MTETMSAAGSTPPAPPTAEEQDGGPFSASPGDTGVVPSAGPAHHGAEILARRVALALHPPDLLRGGVVEGVANPIAPRRGHAFRRREPHHRRNGMRGLEHLGQAGAEKPGLRHRPRNSGLRFSTKARNPSFRSSELTRIEAAYRS